MKMKKLFSLLLCLMLVLLMLPTAVFAARELDPMDESHLTITGKPSSSLKVGAYEIESVSQGGGKYTLEISGPKSSPQTYSIGISTNSKSVYWSAGGLTFTLKDEDQSGGTYNWANKKGSFNITDSNSGTTVVGSNNMTRTSISYSGTIKRNRSFTVSYRVTDLNINLNDVDPNSFTLAGFESVAFTLDKSQPEIKISTTGSGKPDAPLVFDITLDLTYTGTGNSLSFTVGYKLTDGTKRLVDCTTSIPKTEEYVDKDDDDDDDDDKIDLDPLTPYIIVDSYDYGGGSVTAGEDFVLKLRLRNTSKTNGLVNIVMNASPTGVFSMSSSSNTFFIDRLGPGNLLEKEIVVKTGLTKVTDDEDSNAINLSFKFEYVNTANDKNVLIKGESTEKITLPVDFPDRFEMGIPEVGETYQGEDCYVSVSLVNKGRSVVYNLTARIEGDGIANPGQSQFIGNVNAGTESTADFSIRYDESGDFVGNIIVTYEDANMNPKEAIAPFNVTVMENGMGEEMPPMEDPLPPDIPTDLEPEEDPIRPVMIAVGAIVCLMSAYVTVQKAKLKRSLFADEDI